MYLLIDRHCLCLGIFSTKENMRIVIEALIKDDKETNGMPCGDYHFRYIKFKPDELWFKDGNPNSKAILSLNTLHPEHFDHKIETDWSTGEIIKI